MTDQSPIMFAVPCMEQHPDDMVCLYCAGPRAARKERDRIVSIIEENVPHDRYRYMNDCTGCEIIDDLLAKIYG